LDLVTQLAPTHKARCLERKSIINDIQGCIKRLRVITLDIIGKQTNETSIQAYLSSTWSASSLSSSDQLQDGQVLKGLHSLPLPKQLLTFVLHAKHKMDELMSLDASIKQKIDALKILYMEPECEWEAFFDVFSAFGNDLAQTIKEVMSKRSRATAKKITSRSGINADVSNDVHASNAQGVNSAQEPL
jgi:hypothetical protein